MLGRSIPSKWLRDIAFITLLVIQVVGGADNSYGS
jgi:hypothetical protein